MLDTMNNETIPNLKRALEKARAAPPPAPAAPAAPTAAPAATAIAEIAASKATAKVWEQQAAAARKEVGQLRRRIWELEAKATATAQAEAPATTQTNKRSHDGQAGESDAKRAKPAETARGEAPTSEGTAPKGTPTPPKTPVVPLVASTSH
jgi:phage shock protein A